ncbi:MAG TPA: serine/threonine-protein kinase [Streptosporangiaceae bacterium]
MAGDWQVPGYRKIRDLGEGSAGRVVLAVHTATETPVAIKYLSEQLLADEEFLTRFRREARLLAGLRDPNLVRFHEYVESVGRDVAPGDPPRGAAIVMELVDGVSLARLIKAEGPTGPEAALTVLKGSLLGLAAAHSVGVVHRDYKPGNILVRGDGVSKLADFGIAVRAGENVPAAGSPAYMPPEQWSGRPVTPASDVYAATAVFFECLTGLRPFRGRTLPQLALAHRTAPVPLEEVPEALRGLVTRGMAKAAHDRPQSAMAFLEELETTALAAYGPDWERRGRDRLAELAALLAVLFPLAEGVATDGSAVAETVLGATAVGGAAGAGAAGGRFSRRFAYLAAAVTALVVLGSGSVIAYTISGSDSAGGKPSAAGSSPAAGGAGPSADPSAVPSGDPSADPSSPGASPTTTPPTTPPPAGPGGVGAAGGATPLDGVVTLPPVVTIPGGSSSSIPKPPPPPPPTRVTGITIARWTNDGNGSGVGLIQVKTSGTGPVTISVSYAAGEGSDGAESFAESGATSYSIDVKHAFTTQCASPWSITASADGVSDTASTDGQFCE